MKRTVEVDVTLSYDDLPALLMDAAAILEANPLQAGLRNQAEELKKAWAEIDELKAQIEAHVCSTPSNTSVEHSQCVSVKDYQELWQKYSELQTTAFKSTSVKGRRAGNNQTWPIGSLVQIAPHDQYTSYTGGRVVGYQGRGSSRVVVRPSNHGRDEVIERRYISAAKPAFGTIQNGDVAQ